MKKVLIVVSILALATSAFAGTGVWNSKHNIPQVYPGAQGVTDEDTALAAAGAVESVDPNGGTDGAVNRVCGFCHTPHHADLDSAAFGLPLWSRNTVVGTMYSNYDSFTLDGGPAEANIGSSWLCLSCHDGGTAVDQHYNFAGDTNLVGDAFGDAAVGEGLDLTNDHPIGVDMVTAFTAEGAGNWASGLKDPSTEYFINNTKVAGNTISEVLYEGTFVTCSSCHDVHDFDTVAGPYMLYAPLDNSDICLSCHNK